MLKLVIILGTIIGVAYGATTVVGGEDTSISQHPFQISLQRQNGFHFCGGSLISRTWVLTAAHCFKGITSNTLKTLKIRAGSSKYNQGGQLVNVQRVIQYRGFSPSTLDNDIALLQLISPVTVQSAKTARLPVQNQVIADGTRLTVTGWGVTQDGGEVSPVTLKVVQVPSINKGTCSNIYQRTTYKITKNNFCAGYLGVGGKDSCSGDSGGPAAVGITVLGVVSWGVGCASPNFPGVYTQVSRYRNWIKQVTGV